MVVSYPLSSSSSVVLCVARRGIFSNTKHRYCRSNSSHAKMNEAHAENKTAREGEEKRLCIMIVVVAIVSA